MWSPRNEMLTNSKFSHLSKKELVIQSSPSSDDKRVSPCVASEIHFFSLSTSINHCINVRRRKKVYHTERSVKNVTSLHTKRCAIVGQPTVVSRCGNGYHFLLLPRCIGWCQANGERQLVWMYDRHRYDAFFFIATHLWRDCCCCCVVNKNNQIRKIGDKVIEETRESIASIKIRGGQSMQWNHLTCRHQFIARTLQSNKLSLQEERRIAAHSPSTIGSPTAIEMRSDCVSARICSHSHTYSSSNKICIVVYHNFHRCVLASEMGWWWN